MPIIAGQMQSGALIYKLPRVRQADDIVFDGVPTDGIYSITIAEGAGAPVAFTVERKGGALESFHEIATALAGQINLLEDASRLASASATESGMRLVCRKGNVAYTVTVAAPLQAGARRLVITVAAGFNVRAGRAVRRRSGEKDLTLSAYDTTTVVDEIVGVANSTAELYLSGDDVPVECSGIIGVEVYHSVTPDDPVFVWVGGGENNGAFGSRRDAQNAVDCSSRFRYLTSAKSGSAFIRVKS